MKVFICLAAILAVANGAACTCADDKPCQNQNDGSCSQRIDPMGKPVSSGGQCAAGTDDCGTESCSCTADAAPCMNLNDKSCMSRTDVAGKPDPSGTCTPGTKDCLKGVDAFVKRLRGFKTQVLA